MLKEAFFFVDRDEGSFRKNSSIEMILAAVRYECAEC
jgi:hypothetical protein